MSPEGHSSWCTREGGTPGTKSTVSGVGSDTGEPPGCKEILSFDRLSTSGPPSLSERSESRPLLPQTTTLCRRVNVSGSCPEVRHTTHPFPSLRPHNETLRPDRWLRNQGRGRGVGG